MANLANIMGTTATAILQALQRLSQLARNRNGNSEGNANENAEGNGDNTGGAPMTLATILKVHPLIFRGSTNPMKADNWFKAIERALQVQHVLRNQYIEFAAYQLREEAQHWWPAECRLQRLQNEDVPWDVFQTAFYKKYFPESAREAKEIELMQLKQGFLSVADYTSKFEELCRFSRVVYHVSKGLKYDIMTAMAPIEIHIFSDLVNKSVVAYALCQLGPHEVNYSTHDLELAAIVFAPEIWRHHLCGVRFSVFSNHKSLKYVFDRKELKNALEKTDGVAKGLRF
ncbi:uncharacterized protein LOC107474410 [Arachis duranensis]|uniref:Uncharacterized protein LOC107474410 n=1 Tax=Arachis duranensis TaxID=130453 RepID=A0A6P4CED7_ARADU|nr:uncharacterized protein LOC107474410 [Arachis duranensis]